MRQYVGKWPVCWAWRNTVGGLGGIGRTEVDFGGTPSSRQGGGTIATAAVTGQTGIAASGSVLIEPYIDTTQDGTDFAQALLQEWSSVAPSVVAKSVVAGTGFTLECRGPQIGELTPPGGVLVNGGTTINTNVDVTLYTVPTPPTGKNNLILTGFAVRIVQAQVGASSSDTLSIGATAGGIGYLPNQTITPSTTVNTDYGEPTSDCGALFAGDRKMAKMVATAPVVLRLAIANAGSISTQLILSCSLYGYWI